MDKTELDARLDRILKRTPEWDRVHMRTMCTRVRTAQAHDFDAIVQGYGLTRYEALRRFCVAVLRDPSLLSRLPWR